MVNLHYIFSAKSNLHPEKFYEAQVIMEYFYPRQYYANRQPVRPNLESNADEENDVGVGVAELLSKMKKGQMTNKNGK